MKTAKYGVLENVGKEKNLFLIEKISFQRVSSINKAYCCNGSGDHLNDIYFHENLI